MPDIWTLVLDYLANEPREWFLEVVDGLLRWVASTGFASVSVDLRTGCSVVLLYDIGMNAFAIIFIVNSQLCLPKKT